MPCSGVLGGASVSLMLTCRGSAEFELIWVFCPLVWEVDQHLWIRVAENVDGTVVISFHLAERDPWT